MSERSTPSDANAAIRRALLLIDIHGGDFDRWPDDARAFVAAFETDPRFIAARRDCVLLEAALDQASSGVASDALKARILAAAPARAPAAASPGLSSLFGFSGKRLLPAGALAGLCGLGLVVGLVTAPVSAASADEALVYAEAAVDAALGEEDAFWATLE